MCGIAGIYSCDLPIGSNSLVAMVSSMRHRGPDHEGYLFVADGDPTPITFSSSESLTNQLCGSNLSGVPQRGLFMGHKRLSIIDLSSAGHQPMSYADRNLWIIFNGEIYNYKELREELTSKGHRFQSVTDTEVILASYSEWGEKCVNRFNGDWAFALYDAKMKSLFLSRDRYGIKPLYYYYNNFLKVFVFASEIKALTCLPFIPNDINQPKCFEYLVFGLLDYGKETLHRDICQVEPGCNIILNLKSFRIEHRSYYSLNFDRDLGRYSRAKAASYADTIRDLLIDSVRIRLRADVPIGTCLSGGLDSSSIVVIINKLLKEEGVASAQIGTRLKTFTSSFPGEEIDESKYAKLISAHTNADEHFIYPSDTDINREVHALIQHQDEPFGSASIYAQWKVMEQASKHVTVILDGQGGDEVFGGYAHYRSAFLSQLLVAFKPVELANELYHSIRMYSSLKQMMSMLKGFPLCLVPANMKPLLYLRWKKDIVRAALARINMESGSIPFRFITSSFVPNLNEVLHKYQMKYSLQQLLHYEDRNSMAFSIESRTPFTDYRLVDYVFSIPAIFKYHNGWSKWLLRLAMRDLLPKEILWRQDKIGFEVSKTMNVYDRFKLFEIWLESTKKGKTWGKIE